MLGILIGALTLLGWWLGIELLRTGIPDERGMNPVTAICLMLLGLALYQSRDASRASAALPRYLAALVSFLIAARVAGEVLGWGWAVDRWIAGQTGMAEVIPMGANTAVGLTFASIALLLLDFQVPQGARPAEYLALFTGFIGMLGMAGHAYGTESFRGIMAPNTAVALAILSIGLLSARPEHGLVALVGSSGPAGFVMRWVLPIAVAAVVVVGWLRWVGESEGYFDSHFGIALFTVTMIVLLTLLVSASAAFLERADAKRRSAEKALRESREQYRLLFESNPHPVWAYDLETLAFLDVNTAATHHYGYTREEFLAMTIKSIRPAEDIPALLESVAQVGSTEQMTGTWRHRKKNGEVIYVEVVSHPVLFGPRRARLVVATDVTERRKYEEALRASEERFRSIVQAANDAVILADEQGNIIHFNAVAEKCFGYSAEEAVGQSLTLLMPERFHHDHRQGMERYLATGEAHVVGHTVELVGQRKNGEEFPVELSLASWRTDRGVFFTGILRDITDRKQAEQLLRQRTVELEATNRELEAFCYSVSHDLRAPLRGIDGFSQAVLEDYEKVLDARGQDYLRRVRAATQRMAGLIDDLLNLSRVTRAEFHREPVQLSALAESVAEDLHRHDPNRKVETVITPGLAAEGDPRLLRLVLENLLSNAWKFTGRHERARVEFGCNQQNGIPVFFVRDDGAGFDPNYAGRLFGPFQRLHSGAEFPGTGVGLATVQRIIQRHGGRVWAESQVEKGATFYFTLEQTQ